ncbi:MAG: hypothetical protein IKO94_11590, partial [Selenomonadaceae bacterium]|nr:hypothetical protein [Selenomonadaceae bacterium]
MKKDLIRVTGKRPDCYNRVIDVSAQKECFNFVMNTWSGIYRREFLIENNIWHHETPGASFQDNGFWFQTFLHARRAYFVDKAYYMNRRDREDSSVFDTKSVFAICEEYDWIEEKLRETGAYEEYGPLHAYFAFRNYKWTLDRILYEDKPAFYQRLREKFEGYWKSGVIDYRWFRMFNESLALSLWAILNRPEDYYRVFYQEQRLAMENIPSDRPVIIYGAGGVGKDCRDDFLKLGRKKQVAYFAVTRADGEEEPYHDVPVRGIEELTAWCEDATAILAVKPAFRNEMMANLLRLGFQDIRQWPDLDYVLRTDFAPASQQWQGELAKGYVFPYGKVKRGSRILLCGDTRIAESYHEQMEKTGYAEVVQWVGENSSEYAGILPIEPLDAVGAVSYDCVLVAYEDAPSARDAGWELLARGVPAERMVWMDRAPEYVMDRIERKEQLLRAEAEDCLGELQEKLRQEKHALYQLVQESGSSVIPRIVLRGTAGMEQAMADLDAFLEKVGACVSLQIAIGKELSGKDLETI